MGEALKAGENFKERARALEGLSSYTGDDDVLFGTFRTKLRKRF